MLLPLSRHNGVPLYRQIGEQIRQLIERGSLPAGARLPTVRQLALDHGLTRLTVQNAYAELQEQGWIESMVGRGSFVCQHPRRATGVPSPGRLEIAGNLAELIDPHDPVGLLMAQAAPAAETYPVKQLKASLAEAMQQKDVLAYGPVQGDECLRIQMSRILLERGLATQPEQILVTGGAQQAIDLAIRALTTPSQPVVLETPAYPGVLESLQARGQRIIEVPVLAQEGAQAGGLDLEQLEKVCQREHPKMLYTVPTFHNPTGLVTSLEHRRALLQLAGRHDLTVLEDDVYGLLSFEGPAPPPLKAMDEEGRVIYLTSFSKTVAPGLRTGAAVASPAILLALSHLKQSTDLVSSSLLQRGMSEFLRRGFFSAHLHHVCTLYRDRRDALLEAFSQLAPDLLWSVPAGGLSAWIELPPGVVESECFKAIKRNGVILARGQAFFPAKPPSPPAHGGGSLGEQERGHLRMSFGAHQSGELRQAVAALAQAVEQQLRRPGLARPGLRWRPLV